MTCSEKVGMTHAFYNIIKWWTNFVTTCIQICTQTINVLMV